MSLLLLNTPRLFLTSFLLKFFPVPPFLSSIYRTLYHALSVTSSRMHLYAYVLPVPSLASNVLCRLALGFGNRKSDRYDPSCPEEGEVRP
jgi:hypothetical protein